MLTIACVLKQSKIYTSEWVYKLQRSINRNLSIPFKFVCVTDSKLSCDTSPFTMDSEGWWNKIELFYPNLFVEETLYFDLDVIISKPLNQLIDNLRASETNFFMSKEEPFKNPNSSIMYWRGDYSKLYEQYYSNPKYYNRIYTWRHKRRLLGDQGFISESVKHRYIDELTSSNYISWCKDKNIKITKETGLLIFLSNNCKPYMFLDNPFIKANWN